MTAKDADRLYYINCEGKRLPFYKDGVEVRLTEAEAENALIKLRGMPSGKSYRRVTT